MALIQPWESKYDNRLTDCPACGEPFDPDERPCFHIREHLPEDFGLTPLGQI